MSQKGTRREIGGAAGGWITSTDSITGLVLCAMLAHDVLPSASVGGIMARQLGGVDMSDISEFIKGQRACKTGEPSPVDAHPDFIRGYSAQYELEQALEWNPAAKHPVIEQEGE